MLYSDVPIKKAQEDILNRGEFAQNLADVIVEYDSSESFSIGLYGPWGSGKTSVINMVMEAVERESSDVVILRFNPWLCSDSKQLISQFFRQLSSAIKLKPKISATVWKKIDDYSDLFEITGALGKVGLLLSPMATYLTKRAKSNTEKNEQDLQKKKNEIITHLSSEKIKILVAIDDIDRLSEDEIVAIFQLVKSLADFPNTIYLLAFDHEVVVQALSKVQCGEGERYLEKIIQVPFALPKASSQSIENVLFSKLDQAIGGIPEERWDREAWAILYQTGIKTYIRSIRDVLRYSNVFYFKYSLLGQETDAVDLLGLTCLQVFEPALYEQLPFYREQLCGAISPYSSSMREQEAGRVKEAKETILSLAKEQTREAAKNILEILFPKLDDNSRWWGGRVYNRSLFLVHHNVSVPESFSRYFALALAPDELSSIVIENLIFNANEEEAELTIEQIEKEGKIEKLLDELPAYTQQNVPKKLSMERAEILFSCLVRKWDKFVPKEDMSFFAIPFEWKFLFCTRPCLEVLSPQKRFLVLKNRFSDKRVSIYTIRLLLSELEEEHNRFVEEQKEHQSSLVTLEQILDLEQIFVERVCAELEKNTLLYTKGAMQTLWLFEKIAPDLAAEKTNNMVTDDLSVAKLIHHSTGHGKAATILVYKTWYVNLDKISCYIELEEAQKRMEDFMDREDFQLLSEEEQEDIAAFLITMERKSEDGDRVLDSITEDAIQERLHRGEVET